MNERPDDIDDLIGKVLAGEASEEEVLKIRTWCSLQEANQKYFDQLNAIFDQAASNPVRINFDTDAAWQKVKSRLNKKSNQVFMGRKRNYWPALRLAAGLALVLTAGIFAYRWFDEASQTKAIVAELQTVQSTLPDGSTAFLNKQSSITYEYQRGEKTRKVKLKGEGYFEVKHEEEKPFLIEADEAMILDLGTAFNVKAYPGQDTVEVVVQTGSVQFYTKHDPGIMLHAGETGIYTKRGRFFTKIEKADTNVLAYKTGVFSFHATDLKSVIDRINEVYGSRIRLGNDKIGECELTVTFKNDDLNTVVDVIAETMSLTVERTDKNEIILNGKACQ